MRFALRLLVPLRTVEEHEAWLLEEPDPEPEEEYPVDPDDVFETGV